MNRSMNKPITCYQVKFLIDAYMINDSTLTLENRQAFEIHLLNCPKCNQEYKQNKRVMNLIQQYWSYEEENQAFLEKINDPTQQKKVIRQNWKNLQNRHHELNCSVKHQKNLRLFSWAGAVAACLIFGLLTWSTFSNYSGLQTVQDSNPRQIALASKHTVKIELLSPSKGVLIAPGQEIKTFANQQKTILINDKHRMILNSDTVLSLDSLEKNGHLGCAVNLICGQIYAHVKHDGNPFVVDTIHGRAVITGTTFDVKAMPTMVRLAVSEGSVHFESDKGSVKVEAGYVSEISRNSAPTKPQSCNIAELIDWALEEEIKEEYTQIIQSVDGLNFTYFGGFPFVESFNLEGIDYDNWIQQNKDWFKHKFPWVFYIKDALAEEDINVDYPELLIQSGCIWQFAYPENSTTQISVLLSGSLLSIASNYNFDKKWLAKAVPMARFTVAHNSVKNHKYFGSAALNKWLSSLTEIKREPAKLNSMTLLHFLHASVYLARSRTLAWLCVENDMFNLSDENKSKLLSLLRKQINAAYNCMNTTICLIIVANTSYSVQYSDLFDRLARDVNVINECEKTILQMGLQQGLIFNPVFRR